MELIITSLDEIPKVVEKLLIYAEGRKKMTFSGEVGAGKTTFIKAFCEYFKVKEHVTSPTFSLINEYAYQDSDSQQEKYIYHIDLYRLNRPEEALDIGIEDYLFDDNYCLIEWPELINELLPTDRVIIQIEIIDDFTRKFLFL